ncbi:phosphatidylserine decarboxylase-domain-containing protein [Vararia minispora EC-137]|uniref:Phosphatidylserine decarboxylase-domain-containing protein n=1 Tax=Vararia minispora EC-137 TaxID=1314806 RepID=A0ACB8QPR1_9AGAM|nr:phosphatidylserine decarboxylase-domain-containing protein [Vararia minispora EC-137]
MRFAARLVDAWRHTPTKWYPLPWFVGALLLVVVQYRRSARKEVAVDNDGGHVVRLMGPWQVHVLGALPLRNLSRLWGWLNSLELPVWFRPYGFRLYAWLFNCNLSEIEPADLHAYPSLGAFFYRRLKDGARPIDSAPLVSPADGTVLHFGMVQGSRVEQVKGLTYSLDALLGVPRASADPPAAHVQFPTRDMAIVDDEEFANVNGIEYSLDQLIGTSAPSTPSTPISTSAGPDSAQSFPADLEAYQRHPPPKKFGERVDASVTDSRPAHDTALEHARVAAALGAQQTLPPTRHGHGLTPRPGNALFFAVVYLAPGDYHRFHAPAAWVVEKRRHFPGELFSVAPAVARRLENLFVLNERVALIGRWRYGGFCMVPVGATNVGSIKINFDQALRTNVRGRAPPPGTYEEAVYSGASAVLGGQPLRAGQEMGGFCLGSTIVLVFEAPRSFDFAVRAGQKVKVGQRLGSVREKEE